MIHIENIWQEMMMRVMAPKPTKLTHIIKGLNQRSLGNGNVPEAWGNLIKSSTNSPKNIAYDTDYLTMK